ncbi:MAG: hypothetical protein B7Z15_21100 [Rhizobiales bacterium 32-66-8]|nr:MAG: hypothetical protein B7Z15_21100 [Rhizobiales bacterium 32-66-8]
MIAMRRSAKAARKWFFPLYAKQTQLAKVVMAAPRSERYTPPYGPPARKHLITPVIMAPKAASSIGPPGRPEAKSRRSIYQSFRLP